MYRPKLQPVTVLNLEELSKMTPEQRRQFGETRPDLLIVHNLACLTERIGVLIDLIVTANQVNAFRQGIVSKG